MQCGFIINLVKFSKFDFSPNRSRGHGDSKQHTLFTHYQKLEMLQSIFRL